MARPDIEARARAGDGEAFGQLIRSWDHDLRGVVWAVVRSSHATDDVMQSAYEKAFAAIRSFDGRSSLKTWLHSICYYAAIDHVRYEGRRQHDIVDDQIGLPRINDAADQAVARVELDRAFARLDDEQRALLMLTAGLGHSFDETASIVGLPRGTVASKVGRARARLRHVTQRDEGKLA